MKCCLTKADSRGCQICESLNREVVWRQTGRYRDFWRENRDRFELRGMTDNAVISFIL